MQPRKQDSKQLNPLVGGEHYSSASVLRCGPFGHLQSPQKCKHCTFLVTSSHRLLRVRISCLLHWECVWEQKEGKVVGPGHAELTGSRLFINGC